MTLSPMHTPTMPLQPISRDTVTYNFDLSSPEFSNNMNQKRNQEGVLNVSLI